MNEFHHVRPVQGRPNSLWNDLQLASLKYLYRYLHRPATKHAEEVETGFGKWRQGRMYLLPLFLFFQTSSFGFFRRSTGR